MPCKERTLGHVIKMERQIGGTCAHQDADKCQVELGKIDYVSLRR